MLQGRLANATSAAQRFRARVALGNACQIANQAGMARAVFESTERDVAEYGLERWEPGLAAASAQGLLLALRTLAKGGKPLPPDAGLLYDRLCRLDPAAALNIGA